MSDMGDLAEEIIDFIPGDTDIQTVLGALAIVIAIHVKASGDPKTLDAFNRVVRRAYKGMMDQ